MNPLTVQITRTSKPYVLRITGLAPVYGHDGEWLEIHTRGNVHTAEITTPGDYKLNAAGKGTAVVASRRIDTGYIRVSDDGTVTEITAAQVTLPAPVENN